MKIRAYVWGSRVWRVVARAEMAFGMFPHYAMNRSSDMLLRAAELRMRQ